MKYLSEICIDANVEQMPTVDEVVSLYGADYSNSLRLVTETYGGFGVPIAVFADCMELRKAAGALAMTGRPELAEQANHRADDLENGTSESLFDPLWFEGEAARQIFWAAEETGSVDIERVEPTPISGTFSEVADHMPGQELGAGGARLTRLRAARLFGFVSKQAA